MNSCRLISFEVYREPQSRYYFGKVVYQVEDERGIWEETYPRIRLPILQSTQPKIDIVHGIIGDIATIDLGFGELPLKMDDTKSYAERKLVKEKIHDMTIAEIEKKLGYRIKIVDEKGET